MNSIMLAAIAGMFGAGAMTATDQIRSTYRANGRGAWRTRKSPPKRSVWSSIIRDRVTGQFWFRSSGYKSSARSKHNDARKGGVR